MSEEWINVNNTILDNLKISKVKCPICGISMNHMSHTQEMADLQTSILLRKHLETCNEKKFRLEKIQRLMNYH